MRILAAAPDRSVPSDPTTSFRAEQADAFSSRFAPAKRSACAERTAASSLTSCVSDEISLRLCLIVGRLVPQISPFPQTGVYIVLYIWM